MALHHLHSLLADLAPDAIQTVAQPEANLRALVLLYLRASDAFASGPRLAVDEAAWQAGFAMMAAAKRALCHYCVDHGAPAGVEPRVVEAVNDIAATWVAVEVRDRMSMPDVRRDAIESSLFGPLVRGIDVLTSWVRA